MTSESQHTACSVLQGALSNTDVEVINHHVVNDVPIVPGVFQICKIFEAIPETFCLLKKFRFSSPWCPQKSKAFSVEVKDRNIELHSNGRITSSCETSEIASFNSNLKKEDFAKCTNSVDVKNFYEQLKSNGLTYRPEFQRIENMKIGGTNVSAILRSSNHFYTVVDCALHLANQILLKQRPDCFLVPIAAKEIFMKKSIEITGSESDSENVPIPSRDRFGIIESSKKSTDPSNFATLQAYSKIHSMNGRFARFSFWIVSKKEELLFAGIEFTAVICHRGQVVFTED